MKTQKINSIKKLATAMLVIAFFTTNLCWGQQEKTAKRQKQSSTSKSTVKPPSMDIHTASLLGDLKAIQQHIEAGTDLDAKDPYGGSSPLITAAVFGRTEVAKALIEAGANVNFINNDGSTALHSAAFLRRTEIVGMLLENGADKNLKNNFGHTALETVSASFDDVREIYDIFSKDLGPLGLKLDYKAIETTRPRIAEMLR